MPLSRLRLALFLFLLVSFGMMGCGPALYQPSGKLTKGGAPVKLNEKALVQIELFAESDSGMTDPQSVSVDKDGNFKLVGRSGNGVAAGKYKFSVVWMEPYGTPGAKDVLGGAFAKKNAPVIEVKDSKTEIVVDVEKK